MRQAAFFALALACISAPLNAQSLPRETVHKLDSLLTERIGAAGSGCAVGVGVGSERLYVRGAGNAMIEHEIAISPGTTFNLGSISKQFTAYAALHLAREGKLSLEDDIRRYLPDLPIYDAPIRVRDLLQHTSGLRDYVGLARLGNGVARSPDRSMQEFQALMARQRALNFTAGTRHAYVHSDYNMLGLVIEKATGQRLGAVLEERIWAPLGMTSTRQLDERGPPITGQALSYTRGERGVRTRFPFGALRGGTDVYSTVDDMLRWYGHLASPPQAARDLVASFLARPTFRSNETIRYVHGIRHGNYRGLPIVFRGGHGGYFTADHLTFPTEKLTTVALCNDQAIDTEELVRAMADIVLKNRLASLEATVPARAPAPNAELERLTGAYSDPDMPWLDVQISARDGVLHVASRNGTQAWPLRQLADGSFTAGGPVLDFIPDASGRRQLRMAWPYGEEPRLLRRVDAKPTWVPVAERLHVFTGTYFSEDVLHAFKVVQQGNGLVLRRSGRKDAFLVPLLPDIFSVQWENETLVGMKFVRTNGRVAAIELTDTTPFETVRGLRYDRIGDGRPQS